MAAGSEAGHRAVAVSGAPLVLGIGLGLGVVGLRVAVDAGHAGVIGLIDVAIAADRVLMGQPPVRAVVERGTGPRGRVVTVGTRRRETGRNMIGDIAAHRNGALPGRRVAAVAVRRQIPGIVVVYVAGRAGSLRRVGVSSGERKARCAVIELAIGPRRDGMAGSALGSRIRKTRRDVVRHGSADRRGAVPGRLMTAVAVSGTQAVVIADMAGSAGRRRR